MVIAAHRQPGYGLNPRHRQAGITFLIVLFAMAIAGIALAGTGVLWQLESRREKEKELLFIGEEYRRAIDRYYDKTPGEAKQYPEKLEDLLQDKRFPMPIHHLRRLYRDPMTQKVDWELIKQQGRITGVASQSHDEPIKIAGFAAGQEEFEGADSYAKWRFIGSGNSLPPAPVAAPGSL